MLQTIVQTKPCPGIYTLAVITSVCVDVISTPHRKQKLTKLEPGWAPGLWAGGCCWCWFRLSLAASCHSQACVSSQQLWAGNMATDWLGSIVSINCGESLGVYQGRVSAVDQVSQTISLTRPFHNGVKCLVPEVTFRLVTVLFVLLPFSRQGLFGALDVLGLF